MSAGAEKRPGRELRSFGRRRGRKLSPHQQALLRDALPRVSLDLSSPAPAPLTRLFPAKIDDIWLDAGFGGGEHLLWQAERHVTVGFIGSEPFEDGVVKALKAIGVRSLRNVRIHPDDVRPLLRWLPPASLGRAFILFPDPWPKKRHVKRRLVSGSFVDLLARVLKPGAELRIATDVGDYARTILLGLNDHPEFRWQAGSPVDWRMRPLDWPLTRYEAKAGAQGRRCYFLRFIRKS
jgi:tRNA (guanine-N7-)-methyltransferase